ARESPCVESCDRQDATLAVDPGRSMHRGAFDLIGLNACGRLTSRLTLGPRRNQAPAHHHSLRLPVVQPDCGHVLLSRDVESRGEFPPGLRRHELAFRGELARKGVTLTHKSERLRQWATRKCDGPLVFC